MILTGNELNDPDHKVLNELFGKIVKSPADGDYNLKSDTHNNLIITDTAYEKLVALLFGSYYVNTLDEVIPRVTDTDFLRTRDNLGDCYFKEHQQI